MAWANAVNATQTGVQTINSGVWTGSALTQHNLLIGGASSAITSVAPSATAGVAFVSTGATSDPAPGTVVVAGGGTGVATLTAYAVLAGGTTSTGNVQQVSGLGSSGQVLTSNGAAALPSWQSVASGTSFVNVTGATQAMAVQTDYMANNSGGAVAFTLPATATVGQTVSIVGSLTGWTLAQNSGQTINFGSTTTTTGAGGSLASTNAFDCITLRCNVTDTGWVAYDSQGNITVV